MTTTNKTRIFLFGMMLFAAIAIVIFMTYNDSDSAQSHVDSSRTEPSPVKITRTELSPVGITRTRPRRIVDSDAAQLMAFAYCEAAIKNSLKVPSTADIDEYGFGIDPMKGNINSVNSNTFRTYHRVEAQNAFGAKLRKRMSCDVRCTDDTHCTVLALNEN